MPKIFKSLRQGNGKKFQRSEIITTLHDVLESDFFNRLLHSLDYFIFKSANLPAELNLFHFVDYLPLEIFFFSFIFKILYSLLPLNC